jgi:pimeloyl-ACP methyl ester carboxylesterase
MQIVVDDLLTRYNLSGKGKLVLLLHGWGDSIQSFKNMQTSLAKKYQVLAPDLPGFGGTQAPKGVWDLDNYADFLHSLLSKLDLEQPYGVIGHSNGGALAVRSISLGQLKPQKLILLAAAGVRTNNRFKRLFLKIIAKTGNIATIWMPERYRRGLRKSLYGVAGSDMLLKPELQDTFKKTVRQDVQADAVAIATPTLLIFAADDDAIPVADGKQYRQLIKNSRLEMIADAGHFVYLDQPSKTLRLIEEFLK